MKICEECGNELDYCKECASWHCCVNQSRDDEDAKREELKVKFGEYVDYSSHGAGTTSFGKMRESAIAWQNHLYGVDAK